MVCDIYFKGEGAGDGDGFECMNSPGNCRLSGNSGTGTLEITILADLSVFLLFFTHCDDK